MKWINFRVGMAVGLGVLGAVLLAPSAMANSNVKVSRFWHNHQPLYWPEWNGNGSQTSRVQFAWDSIVLKPGQIYDSSRQHPENDLNAIFGVDDRKKAYQDGPRNSVASVNSGGYAMSYSGSLMNNVWSLGANGQLGYGGNWWNGNREARTWTASDGGRKLDLVGFTYHHSLGAVLPKSVFRKELQIFHEAAYKAWNTGNITNRSKGFFPTEMAFSRHMIDVLVDEGYEWAIVASHHLSRTSPSYNDKANPQGSYNIFSSPPNKADQIGPTSSSGWWFGTGNVGETAWNLAPFAYQLHKAKYVNPETGAEKTIMLVPSDDIQSYKAGYSGWQKGLIDANISPFATDPNRPCIVMPSTDGDNAWGGGSSSWDGDAPGLMNNGTYPGVTPQGFVNYYGQYADTVHIEDGAWIFPETCYGSPQFLKWVEPPVANATATNRVHNTQVDMETPGFATKFYAWAPVIAGANWCETAEQMWIAQNGAGSVANWKIQDPYNNFVDGQDTNPNIVERAWNIYLAGLDSGFNYYGGLGNDDEMKSSLATRRAQEILYTYVTNNLNLDATPPTVFKPQRFPYNPGAYTFGWFNIIPGNNSALKKMKSEFYIWTHAYDVSGITNIVVKIRKDNDGTNPLGSNQNETFAGGSEVGGWVTIPMAKRVLPNTATGLTAAANNSQIEYFSQGLPLQNADYYFARIDDSSFPNFRGNLFDYYIEAQDARGNLSKSDIQHVWVADDGNGGPAQSSVSFSPDPRDCTNLVVTYVAAAGVLSNVNPVVLWSSFTGGSPFTSNAMTLVGGGTSTFTFASVPDDAPSLTVYFQNGAGTLTDNRSGQNWSTTIRDCNAPTGTSSVVFSNAPACQPVTIDYRPNVNPLQSATQVYAHVGFNGYSIVWPGQVMTRMAANLWRLILTPTTDVSQLNVCFNNGASTWDNNAGQNWSLALNVCAGPEPLKGFSITNPANDTVVGNASASFNLEGIGESVSGLLVWSNALTGGSGSSFAGVTWQISGIPLGIGSNLITVAGTNVGSAAVTSAVDAAISYQPSSWTNGATLGSGWGGPWTLNGGVEAGAFIGASVGNPNLTISTYAFGLWAHTNYLSEAIRPFSSPLSSGQVFRTTIQNNWILEGKQGVGVALRNAGGANNLVQFYFHGGDTNYTVEDAAGGRSSGIPWTDQGLTIQISMLSSTSYLMQVGAVQIPGTLSGVPQQVRFWNWNGGAGQKYDFFFNNPAIISANASSGIATSDTVVITRQTGNHDSNANGMPDAWEQTHFGSTTGATATADSDGDDALNWEEYIADTVPTNAASVWTNSIVQAGGTGELQLWVPAPTTNSRVYDAWYSTNLMEGGWQAMGFNQPGPANGAAFYFTVTNGGEVRVYRTGVKVP